ncbi:unnamed protein product [Vitrella brassicaformis CCMP3155]|uniref:Protein FAM221A n=1 Tax=Vitrella brassicaformis (strain CCMP3155) TaxID=1169540 RepID=A0A0G4GK69_VITBC|nr:unnamed protein product [Vitrella brassicaformis CCMP3155]|eukprot:CEM30336.1 unnamed protein product [Vitrella brassicaformis CCMP3155]
MAILVLLLARIGSVRKGKEPQRGRQCATRQPRTKREERTEARTAAPGRLPHYLPVPVVVSMCAVKIPADADKHLNAYFEYLNLVGDTDGGALLSEEEYGKLQAKAAKAKENELHVYWRNTSTGMDCKIIGPSSKCFCGHRYRDHAWFETETKKVSCRMQGCRCLMFSYIPIHGSQDLKCRCKHSYEVHDARTKKCTQPSCSCSGFISRFTCGCGSSYENHETVFETRRERQARGLPVSTPAGTGPAALAPTGALNSYLSLADGVDREALIAPPMNQKGITGPAARKALRNESSPSSSSAAAASSPASSSPSRAADEQQDTIDLCMLASTPHKYASTGGVPSSSSRQPAMATRPAIRDTAGSRGRRH